MMVETVVGVPVNALFLHNYFNSLINRLFKILPMKEEDNESLQDYIASVQLELLGCDAFIEALHSDGSFISLLSILQAIKDNPDYSVRKVRREVFHLISLCTRLSSLYIEGGDVQ